MALIRSRTNYGVRTDACADLTRVALGTGVAVTARGAVGLRWVGACAARWIARPSHMALIRSHANDGVRTGARTRLTRVRLGAGATVVTVGSVWLGRIRACPRRRVARASDVTLIRSRTRHRAAALAHSGQARVVRRARVPVLARRVVGLLLLRATPVGRIANPHVMALVKSGANDRITAGLRGRAYA